jgi:prepilin-type processing-associated H-X9-DG protein/prepilin-type N-terminal cleavage/methylation domain-containing protein
VHSTRMSVLEGRPSLHRRVPCDYGFTVLEVLVGAVIMGILFSLIAPAVVSSREAACNNTCKTHLRQLALAVQSYETTHQSFPAGATAGPSGTHGISWFVEMLPYIEQDALYDKYDKSSPNSGHLLFHIKNRQAVDNVKIDSFRCPSSTLEPTSQIGSGSVTVMMPSFVGIAGASNSPGALEHRVSPCCHPRGGGELSASGVLVPNNRIRVSQIVDGLSRTLLVGEASAALVGLEGRLYRVDGGYPLGWTTGTRGRGIPPDFTPSLPAYNITSIRYSANEECFDLAGIYFDHGANNPLTSEHPGGVNVAFADGSVHFIEEGMPASGLMH